MSPIYRWPEALCWRLSNTLAASFCGDALDEAIARYGFPGIPNMDQGSQFRSDKFTTVVKDNNIAISMDGKGARWTMCLSKDFGVV